MLFTGDNYSVSSQHLIYLFCNFPSIFQQFHGFDTRISVQSVTWTRTCPSYTRGPPSPRHPTNWPGCSCQGVKKFNKPHIEKNLCSKNISSCGWWLSLCDGHEEWREWDTDWSHSILLLFLRLSPSASLTSHYWWLTQHELLQSQPDPLESTKG